MWPLFLDFIGGRLGTWGAPISSLSGRPVESFLHLVQSPFGIFAFSESLPEMILFLLEHHLPSGEGSNSSITQAFPPSLVTALPPKQKARPPHIPLLGKPLPKQVTTSPQVRQAVKLLGQAGKIPGAQPGKGHSRLPRGTALPPRQTALVPRKATLHLIPQIGFPKGLPWKTPTQSG